ncbi:phosphatidylserine decarboxylase-domain-containing protein [Copromyces sp. CBS 386.78]|nr:phosphatidylserine decarboxylase-domain-containing protein [Copromyces sp. CBS 386.78]
MASFQLGPVSARVRVSTLSSTAFGRCPTSTRFTRLETPFPASTRAPQAHQMFGRRFFSNHMPKRPRMQWHPIPIGLGIGLLGVMQFYKVYTRDRDEKRQAAAEGSEPGQAGKPKKRRRIRPDGPWQVQVMSTLPLKAMSRLWGKFNELNIPYYLRAPGFRLYAYFFGVNLDEVEEQDLHKFPNLAAFFYRTLKPGVRPVDPNHNAMVSPSDGRILQFGRIEGGDIEQVKGMTYTIDALLGQNSPTPSISGTTLLDESTKAKSVNGDFEGDEELVKKDEEFALVNGISYTLPDLLSGSKKHDKLFKPKDESVTPSKTSETEVSAELALGEKPWYDVLSGGERHTLYYAVIYLAPGDYHRFHSPTEWVVERRRHFAGELFSVSPYLQRTLPGLFTLNERVVLLGRWRWGFFSYVPVGATNVGSIKINFDRELRTNSLTTDTAADRAAELAAAKGEPYLGYAEATYEAASPVLKGHALRRGEEMGGFQLGSTIVLVFEAPVAEHDESGKVIKGWTWNVDKGQKIKMGQTLGHVEL